MWKKPLMMIMLMVSLLLSCGVFDVGVAPQPNSAAGSTAGDEDIPGLTLATPAAQSPAAGICAEFEGEWVTITINPDMPDPRCASIRPEQKLEVVNQRGETVIVGLGNFTIELAAGDGTKIDLPFGEFLAPGVHLIDVQPCCGAELVLSPGQ